MATRYKIRTEADISDAALIVLWNTSNTNTGDNSANSSSVPTGRTLTINGTGYDLSANRSWTVWDMLIWTAQSVTALKTFDKEMAAMKGTSTWKNLISVANTSATDYTNTIPAKAWTFAMTSDITGTNSNTNTWDQTVANTSDWTSHTVTLSASGGSVQLVEWANITLTTTWTSGAGIVTIASTWGSGWPYNPVLTQVMM